MRMNACNEISLMENTIRARLLRITDSRARYIRGMYPSSSFLFIVSNVRRVTSSLIVGVLYAILHSAILHSYYTAVEEGRSLPDSPISPILPARIFESFLESFRAHGGFPILSDRHDINDDVNNAKRARTRQRGV